MKRSASTPAEDLPRKRLERSEERAAPTDATTVEDLQCSICTEMAVAAVRMSCGHSFDEACLQQWFMNSFRTVARLRCPVCRAEPTEVKETVELRRLVEARIASDPSLEPENRQAHFAHPDMPLLPGPLDAFSAASRVQDMALRDALVEEASDANMVTRRLAIRGLANLLSDDANLQSMWADMAVRDALVTAAGEADMETRGAAIDGLADLSNDEANLHPMWADAAVRRALVEAAVDADAEIRGAAIWGLANLSLDDANLQLMWADTALRDVLVTVAGDADMETRGAAILGLAHLSTHAANKPLMWADTVVRDVLVRARVA